jgi:hypothetical protein
LRAQSPQILPRTSCWSRPHAARLLWLAWRRSRLRNAIPRRLWWF